MHMDSQKPSKNNEEALKVGKILLLTAAALALFAVSKGDIPPKNRSVNPTPSSLSKQNLFPITKLTPEKIAQMQKYDDYAWDLDQITIKFGENNPQFPDFKAKAYSGFSQLIKPQDNQKVLTDEKLAYYAQGKYIVRYLLQTVDSNGNVKDQVKEVVFTHSQNDNKDVFKLCNDWILGMNFIHDIK